MCAGFAVFFLFDGEGDESPGSSADNWVRMLSNEDKISPSLKFASGHGYNQQRQLEVAPQMCYSNMLMNGNFEYGLEGWSVSGTVDSIDTVPRDDGTESSVLRFQYRYTTNNGVQQELDPSYLECFSGISFYLRVTADIRLHDAAGAGITNCHNDR